MNEEKLDPIVICSRHPGEQVGFVVCHCILQGQRRVYSVEPATPDRMGWIVCRFHYYNPGVGCDAYLQYAMLCAPCAREQGIQQVGAKIRNPMTPPTSEEAIDE